MVTLITSILGLVMVIMQGYNHNYQNITQHPVMQNVQPEQPKYYFDNNTGIWYMYYQGQWYVNR